MIGAILNGILFGTLIHLVKAPVAQWLICGIVGFPVSLPTAAMPAIDLRFNESAAIPEAPDPEGQRWTNSIEMHFVLVPSGTFIMGSNSSRAGSHEKPPHSVTISRSFYMATTEVTQAQWLAVMGTNPSKFEGNDRRVEQVSWNDAKQFVRKLNAMERTTRYRLPTEAEWEYVCRAGVSGDLHDDVASLAWYDPNSGGESHGVGLKHANAWGVYDMLGNVYEWCEDWKGAYPTGHVTDPRGPTSGWGRVVRGGSWHVHANRTRSYFRDFFAPGYRSGDVGFRVVADARTP
jgi:formylglycine-generating enzyme required for sulfatase activity